MKSIYAAHLTAVSSPIQTKWMNLVCSVKMPCVCDVTQPFHHQHYTLCRLTDTSINKCTDNILYIHTVELLIFVYISKTYICQDWLYVLYELICCTVKESMVFQIVYIGILKRNVLLKVWSFCLRRLFCDEPPLYSILIFLLYWYTDSIGENNWEFNFVTVNI